MLGAQVGELVRLGEGYAGTCEYEAAQVVDLVEDLGGHWFAATLLPILIVQPRLESVDRVQVVVFADFIEGLVDIFRASLDFGGFDTVDLFHQLRQVRRSQLEKFVEGWDHILILRAEALVSVWTAFLEDFVEDVAPVIDLSMAVQEAKEEKIVDADLSIFIFEYA